MAGVTVTRARGGWEPDGSSGSVGLWGDSLSIEDGLRTRVLFSVRLRLLWSGVKP